MNLAQYRTANPEAGEHFDDAMLQLVMNIAGSPPDDSQLQLANIMISQSTRFPDRLWDMARVLDNSGSQGGSAAGQDIDPADATIAQIIAMTAGSFAILAAAKYPVAS